MNKMTLKEKIEVIKAYAEGKIVEAYNEDNDRVLVKQHDVWDFEYDQYRIKPNDTFKFKVNDVLVYRGDADKPSPNLYTVMDIDNNDYTLNGDEFEKSPAIIEKEYISKRDVLWYFEIYDYMSKKYIMNPTRATTAEMDKEFAANHDTLMWKPIYALGFKLKEN